MSIGETNIFPMHMNRKNAILKYLVVIAKGKACPLVKQIYNVFYNANPSDNCISW